MKCRKATERIQLDQRHPGDIQRRVVRPHGSQHRLTTGRSYRNESGRGLPRYQNDERPIFEIVPARLRLIMFGDIA